MLFDGPVGEEAWPDDGSVGPPLMTLGVEEIDLLQKVQEMIRANPGKAESLFEKFIEILKEENKEDLMCNHCPPVLNDQDGWDGNQMRLRLPPSPDNAKTFHKRAVSLSRKVAKKKKVSKGKKVAKKKDRRNMKVERKQTGVENPNRPRKLGKKEKQKENKKKTKTKKTSQKKKRKTETKIKKILKMKKTKQQRKEKQENRERTGYMGKMETQNNNCTSLWAKLTNVGLGMASVLQKQVTDIDFDIKVISLVGNFHKKQ